MGRKNRVIIHKHAPPPAPPPAAKSESRWVDALCELALVAGCIIGFVTVAVWVDAAVHPLPAPGWVCYRIERETAAGRQRGHRCSLLDGWHTERWPNGGTVAVPDEAPGRRHYFLQGL
jgi:hypothetical protein